MKRTKVSLVMAVILLGTLLFCWGETARSQDNVIKLTFSNHTPPEYYISKVLEEWGKDIEKRSKGRVKIIFYHGATMTTQVKCFDGVVKGISDIGSSVFAYTPGRFPLMDVVDLPGYPYNPNIPTRIANDVYKKFQPKELSDVHVFFLHCHTPGVYYFPKKQVKKLEEIKGLKIRSVGTTTKMVQALGAMPVGIPRADEYDALQRGVVDGTVGSPAGLKGWRVADVCKYSTWVPRAGYANSMFVVMNKKKWESLPPDIQRVFTEVSEEYIEKVGTGWIAMDTDSIAYAEKMGHKFYLVDEKEAGRWEKAFKSLEDAYIKNAESKGLPGKAAVEYRKELLKKYSLTYPPIKFIKNANGDSKPSY